MIDPRNPENLVDLDRYPLTEPGTTKFKELTARVQSDLARDGAASLPGFLRPDAIQLMADEADALAPLAYPGPTEVCPYFFNYDLYKSDDPGHPINRKSRRSLAQVAYDLIPPEAALHRLYHWDALPGFLACVLGYEKLFRMIDRFQSLNISIMQENGCQQWHFDRGVFVTTLLLQASEGGGVFEYIPNIREDADENFDDVRAVLDGDTSRIRCIEIEPGMLNLFKGHYSMHRVTPVEGTRRRIQTALAYAPMPDRIGNLKSSLLHYGPRVAIRAGLDREQRLALLPGN